MIKGIEKARGILTPQDLIEKKASVTTKKEAPMLSIKTTDCIAPLPFVRLPDTAASSTTAAETPTKFIPLIISDDSEVFIFIIENMRNKANIRRIIE